MTLLTTHLTRKDLWSLEEYAQRRNEFRKEVMEHKKNRQLALDEHARLYFEDAMTIRYQIQEMLRIEKVFEAEGIQDELDAYNPLIPDGDNWKATFMLEYDEEAERRESLKKLIGIEDKVWMQVEGCERVYAIADEDLDREDDDKTSTVHFVRFQLNADMVGAAKAGNTIRAGISHDNYPQLDIALPDNIRQSLVADLAEPN